MTLTERQKKTLRGLGHGLRPVITVGQAGLSEALLREFEQSLEHHELMKVKVTGGDREARDRILAALCEHAGAELVQRVGNVGLLLRLRARGSRLAARLR